MIIKSLSRKSNTGQLVNYIFKYVFRGQEKNIAATKPEQPMIAKSKFIIRHNIRSRSMKGFIKEFKENESYRIVHRKDSVKLFHTIISFSNKDKEHITDKLLKDIGNKFIEERGLNNLYAGTKHEDKNHIHLHIAISGTQLNGRSSRVSKQKFHSIKLALDKYQREKYPHLVNSLPEHGKSKRLTKEAILQTIKAERQTDKRALFECLETAYSNSKSQDQFISKLTELGHQPYYRNGSFQGIRFEGKTKFRISRLGFDKTRLQALGNIRTSQNRTLSDLQKMRAGTNKELRRTILEPGLKRSDPSLNRKEKQALDELATIRNSEIKEIGKDDFHENQTIACGSEQLNNKEEHEERTDIEREENDTDDPASEIE